MDFELTREQQAVRELARDFGLRQVAPVIQRFDEAQEFPHAILAELGKTGLLGALVPEKYGGAALDYVSYALAVEELNRVDASVGITMWAHNSLCTNHITLFGSPEQKARYLPRLARGEILGAWGLTESTSGSDAAPLSGSSSRSIIVLLASISTGKTMNRSPATNAVPADVPQSRSPGIRTDCQDRYATAST